MPFTTTFNPETGIIETRVWDSVDMDDFKHVLHQWSKLIKEEGAFFLLTDFRQAEMNFPVIRLYEIPRLIDEIFRKHGLDPCSVKRALVIRNNKDDLHLLETIYLNRGQDFRVFEDVETARQWLIKEQPIHIQEKVFNGR